MNIRVCKKCGELDKSSGVTAKSSFRDLWVKGVLSALFIAAIIHFILIITHNNATINLGTRYGYLLWFLAYFFTSNLKNEQSLCIEKWEITYDIGQSILAFISLYLLGFLIPDERYEVYAYVASNFSISLICAFSLVFFRKGNWGNGINTIRIIGIVIALISLAFSAAFFMFVKSGSMQEVYIVFAVLLGMMWCALLTYMYMRMVKNA